MRTRLEAGRLVQRRQRADELNRRAVRVRDDALVGRRRLAVHLRDDERHAVGEPECGGLVDAERPSLDCRGHQLAARRRADREEAKVELARAELFGRRLLDDELSVAVGHGRAGRALRRERAHLLEPPVGEQLEHDGPDRPGGADDADPGLSHAHALPRRCRARTRRAAHERRPRPCPGRRRIRS